MSNSDAIVSPFGRLNWPVLFQPEYPEGDGGKGFQRSVDLLIPKSDPQAAEFTLLCKTRQKNAATEDVGPKAMFGLYDGDIMEDATGNLKKAKYPEYAGTVVIRAKTWHSIPIVDSESKRATEGDVYRGRWARIKFDFRFKKFDDKTTRVTKKMVLCYLFAVQLGKHDERFGGEFDTSGDFGGAATAESLL